MLRGPRTYTDDNIIVRIAAARVTRLIAPVAMVEKKKQFIFTRLYYAFFFFRFFLLSVLSVSRLNVRATAVPVYSLCPRPAYYNDIIIIIIK